MNPRQAGILTMVVSGVIALCAGFLFTNSWTAILGALLLAAATVFVGIGAVWTLKTSWGDATWPPTVEVDHVKALRKQRRAAIATCCLAPLLIGGSLAMIVSGADDVWLFVGFIVVGVINLLSGLSLLRAARSNSSGAATDD